MKRVCLDASIWIKVLTNEPGTLQAQDLVLRFIKERTEIIAPSIMKMEVGSILRKKWSRKLFGQADLNELWQKFSAMPITYTEYPQSYDYAWKIAEMNGLIHLYDAVYLAISEGIEFWTADERLVNSLKYTNSTIKLLQY